MFLTSRFSSFSPYFMLIRAGSCSLLSSSDSCSLPALLQEGCFFSSLGRVSCSCLLFVLWVMWLEHPASRSQPWLLCEVNICRCLNPPQILNTLVGSWAKSLEPSVFYSASLPRMPLLIPPFFVSLGWCRMTPTALLDICEPLGTQFWNSPCGFPSSVSACRFSWSLASPLLALTQPVLKSLLMP